MAAAAASKGSWIARQWRRGWENIPMIMFAQCCTAPIIAFFIGYKIILWDVPIPAEKYRMAYTVMRPDDPRIPRITHKSRIDETGFLLPKLPHYHNE